MTEPYGDRLRAAFDEVLAIPPERRAAFLATLDEEDPRLCRDLLDLIQHVDVHTSFLEPLDATDVHVLLGRGTSSSEWPDEPIPDLEGTTLARRYAVGAKIGAGGAGVVHRAEDRLGGATVAVKVLRDRGERTRHDLRSEAAVLRLLRIPGVVQLLDDGVEERLAYLVTEFVEGRPFPGETRRWTWEDLEAPTTALLEALERVHRSGIVHGDLKPGNVLVKADGVPIILDLGIAEGLRSRAWRRKEGFRRGTLRYVAPERVRDGTLTARSDLYAVGVMLHEALSGVPYRSDPSVAMIRLGIVGGETKPLGDLVGDVPSHVREALALLLAPDPDERPDSAAATIGLFRRGPRGAGAARRVALLDRQTRAREPDALRGLFAGPDRLLHLQEDGARELWRRTEGHPVAVLEELDAWSRAGLGWWEDEVYHLRPQDIVQLQHSPGPLAPPPSPPSPPATEDDAEISPEERVLLRAVDLAGPRATPGLLAQVVGLPPGRVEERLLTFESQGIVRRGTDGGFLLAAGASGRWPLPRAREGEVHRLIARCLSAGDERRLVHLVAAGDLEAVPSEALAVVGALVDRGDLGGARMVLAEGLGALDLHPDEPSTDSLLQKHLEVALQVGTRAALDEHLYQLGRFPVNARRERLERVARGGLHVMEGQPERALHAIPDPAEAVREDERRLIVSGRLYAARMLGEPALEDEIARADRLAESIPSSHIRAAAASARAWRYYRMERYEEAGRSHLEAARAVPLATSRVSALLNAASAFLDAGAFDEAANLADEALLFARKRRHALVEARAEWVVRSAAYRRGSAVDPDRALARASRSLEHPPLLGMIALNEAAIAWRGGDGDAAWELAEMALQAWSGAARRWPRLLASALAAAAAVPLDRPSGERLLAECRECPSPTIAGQAAALVGRACPPLAEACRELIASLFASFPPAAREFRREILSIDEAVKS